MWQRCRSASSSEEKVRLLKEALSTIDTCFFVFREDVIGNFSDEELGQCLPEIEKVILLEACYPDSTFRGTVAWAFLKKGWFNSEAYVNVCLSYAIRHLVQTWGSSSNVAPDLPLLYPKLSALQKSVLRIFIRKAYDQYDGNGLFSSDEKREEVRRLYNGL
ncbi:MAG TPA: hypothetical protein PKA63_12600 [Oligoflexia bacterium]|nr:hypothetical protein [Oligoflexia bacterium]